MSKAGAASIDDAMPLPVGGKSERDVEVDMDSGIISAIIAASATVMVGVAGLLTTYGVSKINKNKERIKDAIGALEVYKAAVDKYDVLLSGLKEAFDKGEKIDLKSPRTYKQEVNAELMDELHRKINYASDTDKLINSLQRML